MAFLLPLLILLVPPAFLVANGVPNSTFTPINRDLYHSRTELLEQVKALVHRHPDKLSVDTIEAGNKGYQAEVTVVTYCKMGRECDERSKFRILLSFGQHGRELITSEVALRILSILSEEQFLPNVNATSLNSTLDKLIIKGEIHSCLRTLLSAAFGIYMDIENLFRNQVLLTMTSAAYLMVVPMENLNGRKRVEEVDPCERRNGRGVDLNRNWSVDWGKKEKDYDPYEENPGIAPFSEPEAQIMRKLALSFEPHVWVNVHSGMEALFMPYDHRNTTPDGFPAHRIKSLLSELNQLHCHNHCMIGSGGGSVGYLAHGTATDYMYDIVKVPMAFTFEIYGDPTASSKDCFKMFNPIDLTTFNRVLNDWSAAFFSIFKLGPHVLDESLSRTNTDKWVSIDEYLDGYLMERRNRYDKKFEVLDLGMQEIRTYFRLFLLSSVLLLFMFCSRIAKSKSSRTGVSPVPV